MPTLEEDADKKKLEKLVDFIMQGAYELGFDENRLNKLRVANEEVIINVINYSYPDVKGKVIVSYEILGDPKKGVLMKVRDYGVPFNPLNKKDPDIDSPIEERPIGGLGIYLVKQIMDEVIYKRENGMNILMMTKHV